MKIVCEASKSELITEMTNEIDSNKRGIFVSKVLVLISALVFVGSCVSLFALDWFGYADSWLMVVAFVALLVSFVAGLMVFTGIINFNEEIDIMNIILSSKNLFSKDILAKYNSKYMVNIVEFNKLFEVYGSINSVKIDVNKNDIICDGFDNKGDAVEYRFKYDNVIFNGSTSVVEFVISNNDSYIRIPSGSDCLPIVFKDDIEIINNIK